MSQYRINASSWIALCSLLFCSSAFFVGCDESSDINVYQVDREDSGRESTQPVVQTSQQMLGAIVANGGSAWFFKLKGAQEQVAPQADSFRSIVDSLSFTAGQPKWTLAEGWEDKAGGGMDTARWLHTATGLEATVTPLGIQAAMDTVAWQAYVLSNVNRWRGQLSLGQQDWDVMSKELDTVAGLGSAELPAYYVSLVGKGSAGGMMGGPFMQGRMPPMMSGGSAAGSVPAESKNGNAKTAGQATADSTTDIKFEVPAGWEQVPPANQMREAQFAIDTDAGKAEAVVSRAGGELDQNMKMWFAQVGATASEDSLDKTMGSGQAVTGGKHEATIYLIDGKQLGGADDKSMLLAQLPVESGFSVYVKLTGPAALVDSQRGALEQFVKSMDW